MVPIRPAPAPMIDRYRVIFPVVGAPEEHEVIGLAREPSLTALKNIVLPFLNGDGMEHVAVLFEGERRDMFVGETSASREPRNIAATQIYWNAAREAISCGVDPRLYPEPWPPICGPAVLFLTRRVWF